MNLDKICQMAVNKKERKLPEKKYNFKRCFWLWFSKWCFHFAVS